MKIKASSYVLCMSLFSSYASANGLAINESSVSASGKANSGRASDIQDASTVYGNPAGMSRLTGNHVSGGVTVLDVRSELSDVQAPAGGSSRGDMVPLTVVPFGFLTSQLNDDWTFGLGFYAPFGINIDYEDSFAGRYQSAGVKVTVMTLQPTLSYKVNDKLSIGLGQTINKLTGTIDNELYNPAIGGTGDTSLKLKGNDFAYGYNFGILFDPIEDVSIGVTYHSKVSYKVRGHNQIAGANGLLGPVPAFGLPGINGKYDAGLDITMPESVDSSATWRINDKLDLSLGALWTRWGRLKTLTINNEGLPPAYSQLNSVSQSLNWNNTWSYSVGMAYQLTESLKLRGGLAYEPTPISNEDLSPLVPTGDRTIATLGLGWKINSDTSVDFGYGHIHEQQISVNQPTSDNGLRPAFSSKYRNSVNGFGVQLNYSF